jgi:beta-glucosidase
MDGCHSSLRAARAEVPNAAATFEKQDAISATKRANDLLKQMTPEEKIGQLNQVFVFGPSASLDKQLQAGWLGSVLFVTDTAQKRVVTGLEVRLADGVQIARKYPSPFSALEKERRPPAWTEVQAAAEFAKAVDLAKDSDIAVLFLGETEAMIGESASRSTLDLPGKEEQLLEAVVATGKPVVLVLLSGRPLNMTWASTHVPAILEAWYPGTEGGEAIANLLTGTCCSRRKATIYMASRRRTDSNILLAHHHAPARESGEALLER